jgi:hypothetical protein
MGELKVGDRISVPWEERRWWVRAWHWLARRPLPTRREFVVTATTEPRRA